MNAITIESLNDKLKNASQNMLDNVSKYIDLFKESELVAKNVYLSEEQKNILNDQLNLDVEQYTKSKVVIKQIRKKYEI